MSTSPQDQPIVALRDIGKTYANGFAALAEVTLEIQAGEFVAIHGASGSGKTTLLHLLAGIDRADQGQLKVAGADLGALDEEALARWRGRAVGVVFQFFQLLPTLTVLENVRMAMDFGGRWPRGERQQRAPALLDRLGVADQSDKFPGTLSGGQQQRVAVARALANGPALLLADEPTGNLDSHHAGQLLDLLAELHAEGQTVVLVTHDPQVRARAQRSVELADGRVIGDRRHA
jgi:putative ABC transport system ATP-binding protein